MADCQKKKENASILKKETTKNLRKVAIKKLITMMVDHLKIKVTINRIMKKIAENLLKLTAQRLMKRVGNSLLKATSTKRFFIKSEKLTN